METVVYSAADGSTVSLPLINCAFYVDLSKNCRFSSTSYLHNTEVPIVHGNLSGETIFIQHNGLIKIGSIAPDIVNAHVKTCIDNSWWAKNRHFMAPELHEIYSSEAAASSLSHSSGSVQLNSANKLPYHTTPAVDIYSFGMVALEVKKNFSSYIYL